MVCLCRTETNGCYPGYDATEWKEKATEPPQELAANDAQGSEATTDPEAPMAPEAPTGYYKRKVKPTWWFSEAIGSELDSRGHLPQIRSFLCMHGFCQSCIIEAVVVHGGHTPRYNARIWLGPRPRPSTICNARTDSTHHIQC